VRVGDNKFHVGDTVYINVGTRRIARILSLYEEIDPGTKCFSLMRIEY